MVHSGNGRVVDSIVQRVLRGKSDVVGPIHRGVSSCPSFISIHMDAAILWYLGPKYLLGGAVVPVGCPTPTVSIHTTSVVFLVVKRTGMGSSPSRIRYELPVGCGLRRARLKARMASSGI